MEPDRWLGVELRHLAALQAIAEEGSFGGAAGTLRVGTYQSVGKHVLPAVMRRFGAAWPRVELKLTELSTDEDLIGLVERGELDLTFADFRESVGPFEEVHLFDDPYVLLVQAGTPLARSRRSRPSLQEVAELPLIGFRQCRSTRIVESQLNDAGLHPGFVFRSDDNGT